MSLVLESLNRELVVMKSELKDAEKRQDDMHNGISTGDCCQVASSVAYFEGYIAGLESAIKVIKEDQLIDEILVERK